MKIGFLFCFILFFLLTPLVQWIPWQAKQTKPANDLRIRMDLSGNRIVFSWHQYSQIWNELFFLVISHSSNLENGDNRSNFSIDLKKILFFSILWVYNDIFPKQISVENDNSPIHVICFSRSSSYSSPKHPFLLNFVFPTFKFVCFDF